MYKIEIEVKFKIGDLVYLKTDKEQSLRIVTWYIVSQKGVLYRLAAANSDSFHYDYEITDD